MRPRSLLFIALTAIVGCASDDILVASVNGGEWLAPIGIRALYEAEPTIADLAISGAYAYALRRERLEIYRFDSIDRLGAALMEAPVGSIEIDFSSRVLVSGDIAYVTCRDGFGLRTVDVANPRAPKVIGFLETDYSVSDACLFEGTLYISWAANAVTRIDVDNPRQPRIGERCDVSGYRISAQGDRLVAWGGIRGRETPVEVYRHVAGGKLSRVASIMTEEPRSALVAGGYLYVATPFALETYALASPNAPVDTILIDGGSGPVFSLDGLLYLGSAFYGTMVFDLDNPARPQLLSIHDSIRPRIPLGTMDASHFFLCDRDFSQAFFRFEYEPLAATALDGGEAWSTRVDGAWETYLEDSPTVVVGDSPLDYARGTTPEAVALCFFSSLMAGDDARNLCLPPEMFQYYDYIEQVAELSAMRPIRVRLNRKKTISSGYHGEALIEAILAMSDGSERSTYVSLQTLFGRWFIVRFFVERVQSVE
jgi:hypothetical protein